MEQYYYNFAIGQSYTAAQLQSSFGIDPATTDIEIINYHEFYPVQESSPDFDVALYDPTFIWVTTPLTPYGEGAIKSYTPVARPLPEAKENGSSELKEAANAQLDEILCDCGINNDVVTAAASQDVASRPTRYQDVLDSMTAVTDNLDSNLTAVESATTVDEINNIVNPPGGTLFTGRGAGLGPEDLNVSYYTAFNSISMTESETELYVPSTATVIAYGSGGPGQFDSFGNCFNPGGPYTMQIRETATSMVIAEIEVPLNPAGEDVTF